MNSSISSRKGVSGSAGGKKRKGNGDSKSSKRQKVLVKKKVLRTSAILLKQQMLSHDSIAKAKKVYESQKNDSSYQPDEVAEWYCEFIALKILQGDYDASAAALSPGGIVDGFWHAHCLDTAGYANFFKDANPPGGEMVHHDALKSQDSAEMIGKRQDKTRAVSHWSYWFASSVLLCFYKFASSHNYFYFFQIKAYKDIFGKECPFLGEYQSDVKVENGFMVYVKQMTGQNFTIVIGAENTIGDLKLIIQNSKGIPPDQQRLIFERRQLEDGRTVSDYGIVPEATIHNVLKLRGC